MTAIIDQPGEPSPSGEEAGFGVTPKLPRNRTTMLVKLGVGIVAAVVLYQLPLMLSKPDVLRLTQVLAFAVAALGLNLLTGFNGQISVGHAAFMGIGAYSTAILASRYETPFFLTMLLGAAVAFVVGLIVGLPALRIKGVYLALVTLALATLFPQLAIKFTGLTGGTQGITLEDNQTVTTPQWAKDLLGLKDNQYRYYVALVVAVVAFVLVRNLVRSRVGRALVAIRDNETPAEVLGVHVGRYKVVTFGLSAMLAGIGGSLLVMNFDHVDANEYGVQRSIIILVAVVVGGVATQLGPAVGAFAVVYVAELFPKSVPEAAPVLFGASLILLMMVAPGGVVGLAKQGWARLRRSAAPPADDGGGIATAGASPGSSP